MPLLTDRNSILKNRASEFAFGVLVILIGLWVIYRSVLLSITNDEAFTFYNVATRNIRMMCGTANTHWLNSIFIFIETLFIGYKEWMIRIHSFLSYFLFAWAVYKTSRLYITNSWQLFIPLAIIILNTYLLDFFSLARGYGLSMAFEMLAFYYICIHDESVKGKFLVYLFLSLATFSCYTCIFILFSYFLYDTISNYHRGRFRRIFSKNSLISQIPFFGICIFAIPNILFIRKEGDLEEGQSNGFIADTLGVFFERSYHITSNSPILYIICFTLFVCFCLFYLKFRNHIDTRIKILFEIFFINVLLIEFVYVAFGIPYVFGRTALYIDLLCLLLIVYVLFFFSNKLPKAVSVITSLVFTICAGYFFIFCKNHRTTVEWWKSQGIEDCISDLEKMEGVNMHQKKLGLHLAQLGSYTNYYQYLYKPPLNDTVYSFRENKEGVYDSLTLKKILAQDYILMLRPYNQYFEGSEFTVLKHYEDMNADLLQVNK